MSFPFPLEVRLRCLPFCSTPLSRIGKESLGLLHRAAHEATRSLDVLGLAPKLSDWESTGGAYFVRDPSSAGGFLAVIKPEDEEPYALNNPKRSGQVLDDADDGAPVLKALRPTAVAAAVPSPLLPPQHPPSTAGGKHRRGKRWPPTPPLPAPRPPTPVDSNARVVEYIRKGILPGEGAAREAAAYLLDHNHHAGVPVRTLQLCSR